jgi:hypothetical protein
MAKTAQNILRQIPAKSDKNTFQDF